MQVSAIRKIPGRISETGEPLMIHMVTIPESDEKISAPAVTRGADPEATPGAAPAAHRAGRGHTDRI
ncbi:hypothetical protein Voc01_088510 [Virgisporangium ochraceum]|uniref:Uncharacterized protein n=1 Tax=Virgisporangium ochraceum TaxID=65505 RepID=A0A8J4A165_9ACTN|nr:hypothetical protein Voc01_088510 [Virgisporangium ochraceum]